jgi:hypothetical protein
LREPGFAADLRDSAPYGAEQFVGGLLGGHVATVRQLVPR